MSIGVSGERAIYFRLAHTFSELKLDRYNKFLFDRKENQGRRQRKGEKFCSCTSPLSGDKVWTNKLFQCVCLGSREEKTPQIYKLFKKKSLSKWSFNAILG